MACYYIVISSTHLRDGQLRSIKGVFRGPIGAGGHKNNQTVRQLFFLLKESPSRYASMKHDRGPTAQLGFIFNGQNSEVHHHSSFFFFFFFACQVQCLRKEWLEQAQQICSVRL